MPLQKRPPECGFCGGDHETVPTESTTTRDGEHGAPCPHCGEFHALDQHPAEIERHPAVPQDEPVTVTCHDCNGTFKITS